MRYIGFATDYDGTLAEHGKVDAETLVALQRLRDSGRRTILISGRELHDLRTVFDRFDLFDRVVVENGALLYRPDTREEVPLVDPLPESFILRLRNEGVPRAVSTTKSRALWTRSLNAGQQTAHRASARVTGSCVLSSGRLHRCRLPTA